MTAERLWESGATVLLRVVRVEDAQEHEFRVDGMIGGESRVRFSAPVPENLADVRDEVAELVSRAVDALIGILNS